MVRKKQANKQMKPIESLKVFSSNGFCHHRQFGKGTHLNYFMRGQIENTEINCFHDK